MTLLVAVGLMAGVMNTLAGGGSLLTVPVLILLGLPGTVANGTNRVGVLIQCLVAAWRFKAEGISEIRTALPLLLPIGLGSLVGAIGVNHIPDSTFEALFGIVMLLLLVPIFRPSTMQIETSTRRWPTWKAMLTFFAIGVYGGAFQAGVGIVLLIALHHSGLDLVRANAAKAVIIAAMTLVAVPVFVLEGRVLWLPAAIVTIGYTAGAAIGTRLAIRGGERVIRPVVVLAILALSGRMLGLY
jgi:hypothetical protein